MVFEFTLSGKKPFFTFDDRDRLRTTLRLPPDFVFLADIARYTGGRYMSSFWATNLTFNTSDGLYQIGGHYSAMSLGQFVIRATAIRQTAPLTGLLIPVTNRWIRYTTAIAPDHNEPKTWPANVSFDDEELEAFLRYSL